MPTPNRATRRHPTPLPVAGPAVGSARLSPDELAIFQRARAQLQQFEQAYGEAQRRVMDLGAHFIERYGLAADRQYTIEDDGQIVVAAGSEPQPTE